MPSRMDVGLGTAAINVSGGGGGTCYPVQLPTGELYVFYMDSNASTANTVVYRKSSDYGLSWSAPVSVSSGAATQLAIWYDKWSGLAGGLIHCAYSLSSNSDVIYRSVDTASSDTLSSETTIAALTSVSTLAANGISICRARGGNLICVFDIDGGTEDGAAKSTDVGATWSTAAGTIADPTEGAADMWILLPGWNADTQDMMLIFWDVSADEISVKRYDDSANTWTETSISGSMVENVQNNGFPHFAAAVDTTNSRNVLIAWNGVDTANQDLKCWTVDDTTITAKTDVVTNATDDCGLCAIAIDTTTNYWYAFWAGKTDGSETWPTSTNIYWSVSTDAGSTWSGATKLTNYADTRRILFAAMRSYGFPLIWNWARILVETSIPARAPVARHQLLG